MCIGFPGEVVAVDAFGATVRTEGRLRRANTLLLPDVAVGEWVFIAAGSVVERLDPAEAELIRATLLEAIALEDAAAEAGAARGVA
jgi:hydrogenase assembly chaperone HypC/HupF